MKLVAIRYGYCFWVGIENGEKFFNVTPKDQKAPNGGYSSSYICAIKKVPNLFIELGVN